MATAYLYNPASFNLDFSDMYGTQISTTFPTTSPTSSNVIYGGTLSIDANYSVDSFSFNESVTGFPMDSSQSDGAAASTLTVDTATSLFGTESLAVGDRVRLLYGIFLVDPNGNEIELYMISRLDAADGVVDDQYELLGVATSTPLDPTVTYTVRQGDPSNPSPAVAHTYPTLAEITGPLQPPCFVQGTMIETDRGPVAVEYLSVGDLVVTRDNGLQSIRWIGRNKISAQWLAVQPHLRPIRISAGALGAGVPAADLYVSPQHRILVKSKIAQKMFGADEVLVSAKQLCQIDGIDVADPVEVTYFHILFDAHEVVFSNGAETESLFTGPEALKSVGQAARDEILALFPELAERDYQPEAARFLASGRMGRKLAVRHSQNGRSLYDQVN